MFVENKPTFVAFLPIPIGQFLLHSTAYHCWTVISRVFPSMQTPAAAFHRRLSFSCLLSISASFRVQDSSLFLFKLSERQQHNPSENGKVLLMCGKSGWPTKMKSILGRFSKTKLSLLCISPECGALIPKDKAEKPSMMVQVKHFDTVLHLQAKIH